VLHVDQIGVEKSDKAPLFEHCFERDGVNGEHRWEVTPDPCRATIWNWKRNWLRTEFIAVIHRDMRAKKGSFLRPVQRIGDFSGVWLILQCC